MKWLLILALCIGCATPQKQDDVIIEDKCEAVEAKMLVKPWFENKERRLILIVEVADKDRIIRAVAQNEEEKGILKWAKQYIDVSFEKGIELVAQQMPEEAQPFLSLGLCGEWVDGDWYEFKAGAIDFEIVMLGVYDIHTARYLTVRTNYGDRWTDAVRGANWKSLLWDLTKRAGKGALP
jgi:hypothetical protein